jgi:hypothetical protein
MFPDDCIQYLLSPWWEKKMPPKRERWRLAWCYVRHVAVAPHEVEVKGRTEAREHAVADVTIKKFLPSGKGKTVINNLPVAGLPLYPGERLTLNRGKMRPALIIATPGTPIEQSLRANHPQAHFAPTYIVLPFYTARVGNEFVRRVKLCEYTQIFWDKLPLNSDHAGSILHFSQIQAVEPEINSLEATDWILSEEGQTVVEDLMLRHLSQAALDPHCLAANAIELLKTRPDIP